MVETSPDTATLKGKILSFYINFAWRLVTFDVLTDTHVVHQNEVIEDKNCRVKIGYKYENLEQLQNDVLDNLTKFSSHAIVLIDVTTVKSHKDERGGVYYKKYTTFSPPSLPVKNNATKCQTFDVSK